MNSSSLTSNTSASGNSGIFTVSTGSHPASIPVGAYYTIYFIQAVIMTMVLTNVPVFLKKGLALDWFALTVSFAVMFVPVLLRPLIAWAADRRPAVLARLLLVGIALVVAGSAIACAGAFGGLGSLIALTTGFAAAVVGATLMNVAADSHIVRAVPLELSARVNSRKRLAAFLGIVLGQGGYMLMVGTDYTNFSSWAIYFAVPAIIAIITYVLFGARHGWGMLPSVEGMPPARAPWWQQVEKITTQNHQSWLLIGALLAISFLFTVPDGLIETTFETFIIELYGDIEWLMYNTAMIVGILLGAVGFFIAGKLGKRAPERDLLWYLPVLAAFEIFLWTAPTFPAVLLATIAIQIPSGFIQVRLLMSWQSHSYSRRPALTFQVFMVIFQLGKVAGIILSGFIMTAIGYAGIFAASFVTVIIALGLTVTYLMVSKR